MRVHQTAGMLAFNLLAAVSVKAEIPEWQRRPDDLRRHLPEQPLNRPQTDGLTVPPLPPVTESHRLSSKTALPVKRIVLSGNQIIPDQVLASICQPYEGRVVTIEELLRLRRQLTLYYVSRGYINSGAIIPDQTVLDGVVEIRIVEGRLNRIQLTRPTRLHRDYITERLKRGNEQALNLNTLKKQVRLLYQSRLVERVNADLVPGLKPGESVLNVDIEESRPYELGFSFNNRRSPGVGSLHGELYGAWYNLSGYGDVLSARYGRTEGVGSVSVAYAIPVNRYDTRFSVFYDRSDADIIEEPFRGLEIRSETENYGFSISHPLYQAPQTELLASISLEKRRSASTSFAAADGSRKGISRVTALRIAHSWTHRSLNQVIALRSAFHVGLDILGTTQNRGDLPDGHFFSWLGQFQWLRKLFDSDNSVVIRSYLQLAADPLLSLEKFGVGGQLTVRGYRENLLVRDNAWVSSIEFRFPLFRLPVPGISQTEQDGTLELATFYDFGWAENQSFREPAVSNVRQPKPIQTLSSIGFGLRWQPHNKVQSQLYWGFPLRSVNTGGEHDLQDDGVHFVLNMQLL